MFETNCARTNQTRTHRSAGRSTFVTFQVFLLMIALQSSARSEVIDVWIGTRRAPTSKGIYHATLDTESGRLSPPTLAAEISSPGFLAMHPNGKVIYAVGSLDKEPSVVAYAIRTGEGNTSLEFINSVATGDGGAAHVAVDPSARTLLTAQYGGGSVAVYSLNEDGSLKGRNQLIEHSGGSDVVPGRQKSPHPHWAGFSPDNRFAFVPDLGLDQVVIYKTDIAGARLNRSGHATLPPGGGPRHMKFHTNGRWIYVLNELDLSVTVFDYDAGEGTMRAKQTIPTVPKELLAKERFKSCSEIRVHPTGHFVYAANRGHDTITAFRVDPESGELSVIERENVRGATPRNFNLDPSGRWLIAAGQDSHTLAVFEVDATTGELTYNRSCVSSPAPICVLFAHE